LNGLVFTFRIPNHKHTRRHDHELYILSGTNPRRPQNQQRPKLGVSSTLSKLPATRSRMSPLAKKSPTRRRRLRFPSMSFPATGTLGTIAMCYTFHRTQTRGTFGALHTRISKLRESLAGQQKLLTSTMARRETSLAGTVLVHPYIPTAHHRLWTALGLTFGWPLSFVNPRRRLVLAGAKEKCSCDGR